MLTVVTPLDSAIQARHELQQALKKLAEAEVAISTALATLDMFETNFRSGYYGETPMAVAAYTTTDTGITAISNKPLKYIYPSQDERERKYRWDEVTGRNQSPSELGYI